MKRNYTDKELAALISQVEEEFNGHLQKAETETVVKNESQAVQSQLTEVYTDNDIQEMDELYTSMTKSEKEAHYQSVKKALFGNGIEKSEKDEVVKENDDLTKKELDEVKAQLEKKEQAYQALQKDFSNLIGKLNNFLKGSNSAPTQKAITDIEYVKKSENTKEESKGQVLSKLTKSEINEKLTKHIRSGKLEDSDRELINSYFFNNQNLDAIKHLLV